MQKSICGANLVWLGDNFGGDGEVLIDVQTGEGPVSMRLEQALRKIDDFSDGSQKRILYGLLHHFDI
ncbi:MAG: hypothetical protein K2Y28_08525 [Burkholderiaceae bacterium]|nr:hypothetical protein [Burkholderiaceae bacterium]